MTAPGGSVRVIVCRVGRLPVIEHLKPDRRGGHLGEMQTIVGGLVDCVSLPDGCDLWCNDEGICMGLPLNRTLMFELGRIDIYGDFFISRVTDDGDLADATDADVAKYTELFDAEDVYAAQIMNEMRLPRAAVLDRTGNTEE